MAARIRAQGRGVELPISSRDEEEDQRGGSRPGVVSAHGHGLGQPVSSDDRSSRGATNSAG